jgi:hypothetical protein
MANATLQPAAQVAIHQEVLGIFSESQDQHCALATALLKELTPDDQRNPPDGHPLMAWRLCQILYDKLSETTDLTLAAAYLNSANVGNGVQMSI